jgi:hypothetical protein
MPRFAFFLALAGGLAVAQAARAQAPPVLLPARDAALSYRVTDARDGRSMMVRAYVKAGAGLVRVDPEGMPGYAILDRAARLLIVVMPAAHGYLRMSIGSAADRFLTQAEGMRFRRTGRETVAGLPCTEWSVTDQRGGPEHSNGDACITADGLVLRVRGTGDNVRGTVVATAVEEAPQPAALFAVPAGFAKLGRLPGGRS